MESSPRPMWRFCTEHRSRRHVNVKIGFQLILFSFLFMYHEGIIVVETSQNTLIIRRYS